MHPQKEPSERQAALQTTRSANFLTWKSTSVDLEKFSPQENKILCARYEGKLVGDYPLEYFTAAKSDFRKRLIVWCSLVGVRETPDQLSFPVLIEYMINNLSGITLEEIELAFKMNLEGVFATKESPTIEAFGQLNVNFLARIILAYKKYRKSAEDKFRESEAKKYLPVPPNLTPYEIDCSWIQIILDDLQALRQGHFIPVAMFSKYTFLVGLGVISNDDMEMEHSRVLAYERLKDRQKNTKDRDQRKELLNILQQIDKSTEIGDEDDPPVPKEGSTLQSLIETEACGILLVDWYKNILRNNPNLDEIFSNAIWKKYPESRPQE